MATALSHIREVDAIVHVVRCFADPEVTHVDGEIDPVRDMETINLELIFADMETVEKRIAKANQSLKGDKKYQAELDFLNIIGAHLKGGNPVRTLKMSEDMAAFVKGLFLLTSKPVIYAANVGEDDAASGNVLSEKVKEAAQREGAGVITLCAKLEEELAELPDEERLCF